MSIKTFTNHWEGNGLQFALKFKSIVILSSIIELSLHKYARVWVSENPYSRIFYAVYPTKKLKKLVLRSLSPFIEKIIFVR